MSTYLPIPQYWGCTKGQNYRHTKVEQTKTTKPRLLRNPAGYRYALSKPISSLIKGL